MQETWLGALRRVLLELLAPSTCAACGVPLDVDGLLCATCDDASAPLFEALPGGIPLVAACAYGGGVARAITRFKYGGRPDLAAPLARRLWPVVASVKPGSDALVVPVPLHPHKLARRGYNQSALLAAELAKLLGLRLRARALQRTRDTSEQASLSRVERLENVAYAIDPRVALTGAHVLLVDDVVTTGATVLACVRALREAGAIKVTTVAVARATERSHVRADEAGHAAALPVRQK
ncbi:MAG TPA: ComF family protein [Polyangiaceae bacterium]|nr:ComF family protein [Polyangiaceae bacterium]